MKQLPPLKEIIQQVKNGDESAFNPFFKAYYKKCLPRLMSMTRSKDEAHDALMNAIFKFWQNFIKGETPLPKSNIEGYIYTSALNGWRDEKGSKKNRMTGEFDANKVERTLLRQSGNIETNHLIAQEEAEELSAEQRKKTLAFRQAFQSMGGICKKLLTETLVYQTKLKDLFEQLQEHFSSYNSIKSKVSQCKKRLQKLTLEAYR